MPTYTVKEIVAARPWSKGGDGEPTVIYYDFNVEEVPERINVGRKPGNPLEVGMKLEGHLEDDQRGNGKKFVKAAGGFGGGGAPGGPRPRDPKERRSIQMQHAQKCAVDALKLAAEYGQGDSKYVPPSAADVVAQVKVIAAGLFQQIEEVSS